MPKDWAGVCVCASLTAEKDVLFKTEFHHFVQWPVLHVQLVAIYRSWVKTDGERIDLYAEALKGVECPLNEFK